MLAVEGSLCRVSTGDLTTNWIQWFALYAVESSDWLAPSLGGCVMLVCPSDDLSQAVTLRGLYSEDSLPSSTHRNKHVRNYHDGALVEYEFAAHSLTNHRLGYFRSCGCGISHCGVMLTLFIYY